MEFDRHSIGSSSSRQHVFERPGSDIKMTGYLKKLKTMKKKYFVLRCTSSSGPARLEYYDSEKKFKSGNLPKRYIHLHTCFNINKKPDSRNGKYGIDLYTNDTCFTVLTESEKDQESWLSVILEHQNEYLPDGDMHKEHYEYVWQVFLQPKGLGQGKGTKGQYRMCLNSTTVSMVKNNSSQPQFSIPLVTIRSVAHHENTFRLEVGNYAPTGAGEFWFNVEDANIAKDMHETLLHYMNSNSKNTNPRRDQQSLHSRTKRDSQIQPMSYGSTNPLDAHSPSSPNYPIEYPGGGHRLRSDSRTSRTSKTSFHEDGSPGFLMGYNGDHLDVGMMRDHGNVVPPDMSPPPSPSCLDEQINDYLAMDMERSKQRSSVTSVTSAGSHSSTYLPMIVDTQGTSHKGEMSNSYPDVPSTNDGYVPMVVHHVQPSSHPISIHTHSFSELIHSTHLPTVREGGSNEGYLPMDIPSSPASSSGAPRPDPATCLLSDSSTGLPPRTYSLGSKPTKVSSYMAMGPKSGAGNDMSRATSAPHILKGRRERDHRTESPAPSASPLSMSLKSDDSDSFMEYMPMRPRTASDSFNYRNRTSSFGKIQQNCRPRSSSHGQGKRPVINLNKLSVEKARTSGESSPQGSFDSLRISNESLRRMSQEMRHTSGSNASDYAEMRGTPSPQMKTIKSDPDAYISMQVGTGARRSSPHRVRTDSTSSGRYPESKTSSSDRLHHQPHLQQITDYTEMTPLNASTGNTGESYMNMDYNIQHSSSSSDSKSISAGSQMLSSHQEDVGYVNMDMYDSSRKTSDANRSLSMENVDNYIFFNPNSGSKPRTGSLGSKDKAVSRPTSARKSSSASVSSSSSPSSSGFFHHQNQASVSSSTRTGGSSDSFTKASRQSSTEKHGSLGKDFRKKSGSTGSRPSTGKSSFGVNLGNHQHASGAAVMPVRKPSASRLPQEDSADDEYIEFSPNATKEGSHHHHHQGQSNFPHSGISHSSMPLSNSSKNSSFVSSGNFSSTRSNPIPSPAESDAYTLYNPAASASTKSVHFQHKEQYSQHHPPHIKAGSSPSYSAAHVKHVAAKDVEEYVGFDPGTKSISSHASSHLFSNNIKQVEAKEEPQYVGFEPGIKPFSTASVSPSLHPKKVSPKKQDEYVGYEPGTASQLSHKPITPSSAVSYIQKIEDTDLTSKPKQLGPKPDMKPSDIAPKLYNQNHRSVNTSHQLPTSPIFDPPGQTVSAVLSQIPPVPPLSSSTTSSQQAHTISKPVVKDCSDYLQYSPAASTLKVSQENTPDKGSLTQASIKPQLTSNTLDEAASFTQTSIKPQFTSITPDEADGLKQVSLKSQLMGITPDKDGSLSQANVKPQLAQLFIDVGENSNTSTVTHKSENSPSEQNKQKLQQKPQQMPQSFHRQLSAPVSHLSPVGKPAVVESQIQPNSPQPMSPDSLSSTRHKHLSSSSTLDSPSPTGSGSRHKHWSGSSTSSQKSRKSSSDSEKTSRKGRKSDSSSGSSSGKSRRRIPSGAKSPEGFPEEKSQSRKNNDVFLSTGQSSSLEAKIVPAEAKIRHSLGDVTSVVNKANKEGQDHHGMIRPDSTPCIQNLALSTDQGSRSVGDTPSSTPKSGSTPFSVGPRIHHSLSDLGAYQQMTFPSPVQAPLISESNNNPGSKGMGSNVGINESSMDEQTPKPLNYVKLDLGCLEGQGDADGKSFKIKSRNSSDADEKQLPLSYAEIDFEKSQSRNRPLLGYSWDNLSSKS